MRKLSGRLSVVAVFAAGWYIGSARAEPAVATEAAQDDRVFELRTYVAPDGKLSDLHRRFREHTTQYFETHGMTSIGYWVPQDAPGSSNTIVYLLAYPNREAATASWAAFQADPGWVEARTASEVNGPIVSTRESVFLVPTDYSPLR